MTYWTQPYPMSADHALRVRVYLRAGAAVDVPRDLAKATAKAMTPAKRLVGYDPHVSYSYADMVRRQATVPWE